jgi:hypothetical protein
VCVCVCVFMCVFMCVVCVRVVFCVCLLDGCGSVAFFLSTCWLFFFALRVFFVVFFLLFCFVALTLCCVC